MSRISLMAKSLVKELGLYIAGDSENQGTGKFTLGTLIDWVKTGLNLTPSSVGLGNVTNTLQATKAEYDAHINGTSDNHDASAITFNSSTVQNELMTLKNRLNESMTLNNRDIHIVITNYTAGDASWTEAEILAMIGIDNANYTDFNYRIDQRFPVYIYELNKVAGHATNVNIPTDKIDISFEVTGEGNYHMKGLTINDNVFTATEDYRISLTVRLYKEYFTPTV